MFSWIFPRVFALSLKKSLGFSWGFKDFLCYVEDLLLERDFLGLCDLSVDWRKVSTIGLAS